MSVFKRRKIMLVTVIAAVAVFAVSALAAGAGFSGYERLKNAGFQMIDELSKDGGAYSNGMFFINMAVYIDGEELIRQESTTIRDGDRKFSQESTYNGTRAYDDEMQFEFGRDSETVTYTDNDVVYRWYDGWNNESSFSERENWSSYNNYPGIDEMMPPAQRRFIEAVADALIGDTRNYFISDGNIVSIALSGNQIPQIAQYAVAAIAERAERDAIFYGNDVVSDFRIGVDARFSNGRLEVELDDNGNVIGMHLDVEISSTVDGMLRSFRITAELLTKNIGMTSIQKPDGNSYGRPILPSYEDDDSTGVTYAYGTAVA